MEVLLNKELEKIVNKNLFSYQEDLLLDIQVLLDKNKMTDTFIFLARKAGTNLYEKSKLFCMEAGERKNYLYFKDYDAVAYEINVTKRGIKNIYGTIKKINKDKLTKDIINNSKS